MSTGAVMLLSVIAGVGALMILGVLLQIYAQNRMMKMYKDVSKEFDLKDDEFMFRLTTFVKKDKDKGDK